MHFTQIYEILILVVLTRRNMYVQLARNLLPVCKNFRFSVTFPTPYPLPFLSSTLPLLYTVRSVQALSHSGILFSGVYKTRLHAQKNNENQIYECMIIKLDVSILISPLETSHGSGSRGYIQLTTFLRVTCKQSCLFSSCKILS